MKILDKNESESIFNQLSSNINHLLDSIDLNIEATLIKPEWEENRIRFRNTLRAGIDKNFLKNPQIAGLMFMSDLDVFTAEMKDIDPASINMFEEYDFSNKNATTNGKNISTNSLHHLYHISSFKKNKKNLNEIKSVLEWGGGYGNMAKLFIEIDHVERYTIIDIPEFTVLQYIYLSSYFGKENVRIIKNKNEIGDGINLIPLSVAYDNEIDSHDLFVSTWAISESTIKCQEYAEKNSFFDYNNILIAYHQCGNHIPFMTESTNIDKKMKEKRATIQKIHFIPGINFYALK